ncbi:MAG: class I SAM-dependent methyltransferase, partial [Alphaproteobacteria bacterium]
MSRARERLARMRAQLYQLAGLREGGFFIQYDYSASVPETVGVYPEIERLFAGSAGSISELADRILSLRSDIEAARCEGALRMDSMMFPRLDAMAAYAMLRTHRPRRVLEIGSGHSTAVLARALAENGAGELTCIDPSPNKPIDHLKVNLLQRLLQEDDAERVETFEAGDVLFIDSSHIMLQGTDVDIQFNRMFPRLKPGVLVQLHDVFLPDGYPPKWRNRWYSE